jgi:hypothetical protein
MAWFNQGGIKYMDLLLWICYSIVLNICFSRKEEGMKYFSEGKYNISL